MTNLTGTDATPALRALGLEALAFAETKMTSPSPSALIEITMERTDPIYIGTMRFIAGGWLIERGVAGDLAQACLDVALAA